MSKRVLVVLEAGDAFPSGRIRGLIYKDCFRAHGIDARYVSRLSPRLMRFLESISHLLLPFLAGSGKASAQGKLEILAWPRERAIVRLARDYDVVYMSKVRSLRLIHALRRETKARLVLDFGDALWLPALNVDRFDEILGSVDAVTTDNAMTAEHVRRVNPACVVIPDCPPLARFEARRQDLATRKAGRVRIGWVGTASTAYNLYVIWEALERVFATHPDVELRLVGVQPNHPNLPRFEYVRYSCLPSYGEPEMVDEVLAMDIGLFPLQDVDACRVRGVLKATVYMSGAVAVVASPIGQTPELIVDGQNGLLATSTDEWVEKLGRLIQDTALRRRLGDAGLQSVRQGFTVEHSFGLLRDVLFPPERA